MADKLTHIDADGRARMVDVSDKAATKRIAKAEGRVLMSGVALELARSKGGKGDVRATAEIAGVMAAKRTSDLIPMCHPLDIARAEVTVEPVDLGHQPDGPVRCKGVQSAAQQSVLPLRA